MLASIRKWFLRLVWIPAFVLALLFLIANREPVSVSLDPFSASSPSVTTPALPLWAWLMTMLFLGIASGAAGMWLSGARRRARMREERRELKSLRRELTVLTEQLRTAEARANASSPPLLESADA